MKKMFTAADAKELAKEVKVRRVQKEREEEERRKAAAAKLVSGSKRKPQGSSISITGYSSDNLIDVRRGMLAAALTGGFYFQVDGGFLPQPAELLSSGFYVVQKGYIDSHQPSSSSMENADRISSINDKLIELTVNFVNKNWTDFRRHPELSDKDELMEWFFEYIQFAIDDDQCDDLDYCAGEFDRYVSTALIKKYDEYVRHADKLLLERSRLFRIIEDEAASQADRFANKLIQGEVRYTHKHVVSGFFPNNMDEFQVCHPGNTFFIHWPNIVCNGPCSKLYSAEGFAWLMGEPGQEMLEYLQALVREAALSERRATRIQVRLGSKGTWLMQGGEGGEEVPSLPPQDLSDVLSLLQFRVLTSGADSSNQSLKVSW